MATRRTTENKSKSTATLTSVKATITWLNPDDKSKIVALANIVIDDAFVVNGLRIIVGKENELFIGFNSTKGKDGKYHDKEYPMSDECRKQIEDAVIKAYDNY